MEKPVDNYSPPAVHVWGEGKNQEAKENVVCKVMSQRLNVNFSSYQQYRATLKSLLDSFNKDNTNAQ